MANPPPPAVPHQLGHASLSGPPPSSNNDADVKLKALLDQQARIQAEIASLAPVQNGVDFRNELVMLNHKYKILKGCQEEMGLEMLVLSEAEECRILQYKTECLETSCLRSGAFPSVKDLIDRTSVPLRAAQPPGFDEWQHQNSTKYDPILSRSSTVSEAAIRQPDINSFKCHDSSCFHYVYGFTDPIELENHHGTQHGLSQSNRIRTSSISEIHRGYQAPDPYYTGRPRMGSTSLPPPPPMYGSPYAQSGSPYTAPRRISQQYSFVPVAPRPQGQMHIESSNTNNVESQNRRLSKEVGPCLRCKVLKKKCDARDPCSLCPENVSSASGDFWKAVGCHRGPLSSFTEIFAPAQFNTQSNANPNPSGPSIRMPHELLSNAPEHETFLSKWSTQIKAGSMSSDININEFTEVLPFLTSIRDHTHDKPTWAVFDWANPPAYALLKSCDSRILEHTFSILALFHFSAKVSGSAQSERENYPLLYHSKMLLREAYIFKESMLARLEDSRLIYDRYSHLHGEVSRFLALFDELTVRRTSFDSKNWFATFCSLCFLSAAKTFLISAPLLSPQGGILLQNLSESITMTSVYKVLVSTFMWSNPSLLDDETINLDNEERALLQELREIIGKERWRYYSIGSGKEFLMGLGSGTFHDGHFNGFVQEMHFSKRPGNPLGLALIVQLESDNDGKGGNPSFQSLPRGTSPAHPLIMSNKQAVSHNGSDTTTYSRPKHDRIFCMQCEAHPEGFRGEHELRRHLDREHPRSTIKKWICTEPTDTSVNHPQPSYPLAKCKNCSLPKKYGAYYNAAAHLRRAHFRPKPRGRGSHAAEGEGRRGGKGGGDWPPMSELKFWMREVEELIPEIQPKTEEQDSEDESDRRMSAVPESRHPLPSFQQDQSRDSAMASASPQPSPMSRTEKTITPQPAVHPLPSAASPQNYPLLNPQQSSSTSSPHNPSHKICPYPSCGRTFRDLPSHILTHLSSRPEKCPVPTCDYHTKGFARKYDKNRHALTHYSGVLVCPFCPGGGKEGGGKVFNRADGMKRHLLGVHKVDQTPKDNENGESVNGIRGLGDGEGREGVGLGGVKERGGKCLICKREWGSAQAYYEHLDDCVMAVITPATGTEDREDTEKGKDREYEMEKQKSRAAEEDQDVQMTE